LIEAEVFGINGLMQECRQADNIVGALQLLRRDVACVCAALRDDMMVLTAIARWAEPLGYAEPLG
jgi:hypothetical protein